MDFTILLQALPLIGSGMTALIVFIKRGVTTDIDVTKMHEDIIEIKKDTKEINNKLIEGLKDIAVSKVEILGLQVVQLRHDDMLKEKLRNRNAKVEEDG